MKLRVFYHITFWTFFTLFFLQLNPEADLPEALAFLPILGMVAAVVYINLYFLFPKYFFTKKYWTYGLILGMLITLGVVVLRFIFPSSESPYYLPIVELYINFIFFVFITSSLKFYREFLRKQEQLVKVENEQLKTELSLLKSQVNPHFLFNTLNNLYGLIVQNQNQQAADITLKLSDLMRYLLESSKSEKVSLKKEVKFIEDYLALEKIRLAQQADIRFELSGLDKDYSIAPLLFIPLVENAFKHGLQSISENSFAYFSLAVQGKDLYFEARNSVGKKHSDQVKSQTGLTNLRKRLALMYPENHLLEIEEKESSFNVTLHIHI